MNTLGKIGWALFLAAALVAAYFIRDAIVANARADAHREAWAASEEAYQVERTADSIELAVRADSIGKLNARRVSAGSAVGAARPGLDNAAAVVERLIPDTATARAFRSYRDSVNVTLDSAAAAIARADSLQDLWDAQAATYEHDLAVVQGRLTAAITRAETAERARRPTLLTHATKVLAVVGTAVILDRVGCAVGVKTLLPCSARTYSIE
jgi:hypothetical protein